MWTQFGSIHIGNLFDCQTSLIQVPLPTHFADPSNHFLPPENYYEPMSECTSSFDIWQFGILHLYVITGFQPVSYGTELLKYIFCIKVTNFQFHMGPGKAPSILELDSYKLFPYKKTKLN